MFEGFLLTLLTSCGCGYLQKERVELQRGFSLWKLRHMDDKREVIMDEYYHK